MALHLISFAFAPQTAPRAALFDAIQAMGSAAQVLTCQWLLVSRRSQAEILGELARYIDDRDCLIVASIDPSKLASYNLPESVKRWLAMSVRRLSAETRHASSMRLATLRTTSGVSGICRDFPD